MDEIMRLEVELFELEREAAYAEAAGDDKELSAIEVEIAHIENRIQELSM